jgi:L-gulono-1,4-lactone dehydrogenase
MLENWVGGLFALAGRHLPSQAPRLARIASQGTGRSRKLDKSHRVYASERRVKFTEMEYGIPREHAAEAVREVLAIAARPEHRVAFPIEVRFAAADEVMLSAAHRRSTCYIAVHQDRKVDWRPYFSEVEVVMRSHGGRPHWGKRHTQAAETLAGLYPRWADFQALRDRLDPERRFANAYTERVLG